MTGDAATLGSIIAAHESVRRALANLQRMEQNRLDGTDPRDQPGNVVRSVLWDLETADRALAALTGNPVAERPMAVLPTDIPTPVFQPPLFP